jgi:hypothetical protein
MTAFYFEPSPCFRGPKHGRPCECDFPSALTIAPMKTRFCTLLATMLVALATSAAHAEDWVFARSYYSHQPVTPVQIARRPPGDMFYSRPQGDYVRSGYRNVRSTIVVGGYSYDHAQFYESWIQVGSQF